MNRHTFLVILLLFITGSAKAQQPLSPESFVQQIRQNVSRLEGWSKVYAKDGSFWKISIYGPTAKSIDVVRSESVLRPFMGKLQFFVSFAHGENFDSSEGAETSRYVPNGKNMTTNECLMEFVPESNAWEISRIRCRSTVMPNFREFQRSEIGDNPLGEVLRVLEMARTPQVVKPVSKKNHT